MGIFRKEKLGNGCRAIYLGGWRICYYKRNANRKDRFRNCDISPLASIDGATEIGEYTYVGKDVDITKAKIGRYCAIGSHVRIGQGEHDMSQISMSGFLTSGSSSMMSRPCEIGNDVWVGTESIIRRGVRVGNFAVIGANSFVNKDVPDFAVAVGSPARVVRLRFDEETRRRITESRYWLLPPEEAKKIIRELEK